jgi:hypothetical protein
MPGNLELLPLISQLPGNPAVDQNDPMPPEESNSLNELLPLMGYSMATNPSGPPSEPVLEQPQLEVPVTQSISQGQSVSARGFSPQAYNKVVNTAGSRLDRRIAAENDRVERTYKPYMIRQNLAGEAVKSSAEEIGQAESDIVMAKAQGQKDMAAAYQRMETETKKAADDAKAAGDAAKAQYQTALQSIPSINPNELWETSGTVGQFGMSVAAFVHDFLGAGGIKTSAMDTINNAVQRNMQAQLQRIEKGKAVASGFKDLWEMQRAQSSSNQEAMARMHGIMLKSLQAGIDAEMGKYDSRLALAKSQQARALIEQEIVNKQMAVQSHIDAAQNNAAQRLIAINGQELQASIASAQIAESRATRLAAEKAARAKAAQGSAVIYDISESGKGQAKWRIAPELADDKELVRGVVNKAAGTQTAIESLRELNELQSEMESSPDGLNKTRLAKEIDRRENALRSRIVMALVLDQSGKQVTDKEREFIEKLVPAKTWFTNGTNRRIISQLIEGKGNELNTLLQQTTVDITEGDPAYGRISARNRYAEPEITEAKVIKEGAEVIADEPVDKANKLLLSPDANSPISAKDKEELATTVDASSIEDRWKDFASNVPGSTGAKPSNKKPETTQELVEENWRVQRENNEAWIDPKKPTKAFVAMDTYRRLAAKGDENARQQLELWASMYSTGVPIAPDGSDANSTEAYRRHLMALYELTQLRKKN